MNKAHNISTRQHVRDVNTALDRQGYTEDQKREWWRQQLFKQKYESHKKKQQRCAE